MSKIQEEIKKRILVLDGAMGTMLQRYKFEEEDFLSYLENKWCTPYLVCTAALAQW